MSTNQTSESMVYDAGTTQVFNNLIFDLKMSKPYAEGKITTLIYGTGKIQLSTCRKLNFDLYNSPDNKLKKNQKQNIKTETLKCWKINR